MPWMMIWRWSLAPWTAKDYECEDLKRAELIIFLAHQRNLV